MIPFKNLIKVFGTGYPGGDKRQERTRADLLLLDAGTVARSFRGVWTPALY